MSARISDRHNGLHATPIPSLLIFLIATLSLTAAGQSPSPANTGATASESVLPRNVVVPISVVNRFFPQVTEELRIGRNLTAVGSPTATMSVIYANSGSTKKVTITVDQYPTASDASSAYREAVAKSKTVAGFKPVHAENVGQNTFVGTVTQGEETHIGLGALHGTLIVGVTLAGYDPTPETTARLISVTREEENVAKAALNPIPKK